MGIDSGITTKLAILKEASQGLYLAQALAQALEGQRRQHGVLNLASSGRLSWLTGRANCVPWAAIWHCHGSSNGKHSGVVKLGGRRGQQRILRTQQASARGQRQARGAADGPALAAAARRARLGNALPSRAPGQQPGVAGAAPCERPPLRAGRQRQQMVRRSGVDWHSSCRFSFAFGKLCHGWRCRVLCRGGRAWGRCNCLLSSLTC